MWIPSIVTVISLFHNYTPSIGVWVGLAAAGCDAVSKYKTGMFLHQWLSFLLLAKTGCTVSDVVLLNFHKQSDQTTYQSTDTGHQLNYSYLNTPYSIVWPKQKSDILFMDCMDPAHATLGRSCFEELKIFLGPRKDFHGVDVTPHLLGHNHIEVTYLSDSEVPKRTFIDDNVIRLSVSSSVN